MLAGRIRPPGGALSHRPLVQKGLRNLAAWRRGGVAARTKLRWSETSLYEEANPRSDERD